MIKIHFQPDPNNAWSTMCTYNRDSHHGVRSSRRVADVTCIVCLQKLHKELSRNLRVATRNNDAERIAKLQKRIALVTEKLQK